MSGPTAAEETVNICGCGGKSAITETRTVARMIRRARRCSSCGVTWSTREVRVPRHVRTERAIVFMVSSVGSTTGLGKLWVCTSAVGWMASTLLFTSTST